MCTHTAGSMLAPPTYSINSRDSAELGLISLGFTAEIHVKQAVLGRHIGSNGGQFAGGHHS